MSGFPLASAEIFKNNERKSLIIADRQEDALTAWLQAHPEIEVISRDRAGAYAAEAKKGAPQAQQIADKFHIVKNLREGLQELMVRKQKVLPEVEEGSCDFDALCHLLHCLLCPLATTLSPWQQTTAR